MEVNKTVRFARIDELERINELRKVVNDIHVYGCPDFFKPGFKDVADQLPAIWAADDKDIIVAELDGLVCGYACIHYVNKPESPFTKAMKMCCVDEFCVDVAYRRKGLATDMISFIRTVAKEHGISRLDLNVWGFNEEAIAFYEAVGFQTYRRYMELKD